MKTKITRLIALVFLGLMLLGNTIVHASDKPLQAQLPGTLGRTVNEANDQPGSENTTIITKTATDSQSVSLPTPTPPAATPVPVPKIILYPIEVQEFFSDNGRQIIKTYALSTSEKPENIEADIFERDGWKYTLTDIIKKETASADVKEHTETIRMDTSTKDLDAILKQLAPTLEHKTEDGYAGILQLDISSIKCETAGYKNSSYTVSATREYPHLSANDTSLIPKTITDNGKTLSLANVNWRSQNTTAVDYNAIPDSYTAIANYTATGTKTSITGYVTIAEYKGSLSKLITGKTIYTAYFIGSEILKPTPKPTVTPMPTPTPEPIPVLEPPKSSVLPIAATATAATTGTGLIGGFVFFFFIRKNVKVFNLRAGKYEPIGKVRVAYKTPIIDLTCFTDKAASGSFILVLDKLAAKKLNSQVVTVNYGEKSFQHILDGGDGEYQFEVDF